MNEIIDLVTPITDDVVASLEIGKRITISGYILCGRDAVLPKIVNKINQKEKLDIELKGQVIFHTAVSPAGVGPTSSNKLEIERSIEPLSKAGVKIHLGKGKIKKETIEALNNNNSIYAIIPPVTALLSKKTSDIKCVAFPELGMEALYMIYVEKYPAIVGAAHGRSIYE